MKSKSQQKRREVDIPRMLLLLGIEFKDHNGELWACCPHPDHNEKTASWSIKDHGGHYCFGCHWGGGPAELVRANMGLAVISSAIAWLEDKGLYQDGKLPLNVDVQVSRPALGRPEVQIPADARFGKPLDQWVTPAKRYAEKRGITQAQIDRWELGYACGGYFANRLLIPTRCREGRLINITGRAWSATKTPKYLNSKELHGWDPSAIFGERYWPPAQLCGRATLVLCEGELNAMACEAAGAMFVGALGGSTLEKEQVLKVSVFKEVVLATDLDRAGSQIAEQLRATLARWRRCRRVDFPDRRDPNDLLTQDPNLLRSLLWPTSRTAATSER